MAIKYEHNDTGIQVSLEARILKKYGQHMLAGFYEEKNAPILARVSRGLLRYCEAADPPGYHGGSLYPSGICEFWKLIPDQVSVYHYAWGFSLNKQNPDLLKNIKSTDSVEQYILKDIDRDLSTYAYNPILSSFDVAAPAMTHSTLNYGRIFAEGLTGYRRRVLEKLKKANEANTMYFYRALVEVLDGLVIFHGKCLMRLQKALTLAPSKDLSRLVKAFAHTPLEPARSFYEAMVGLNFMWHIDGSDLGTGADSVGRFDQYMYPYYKNDKKRGMITKAETARYLAEFWKNIDLNEGWNITLGGSDRNGKASYNELTELCLKSLEGRRRPNSGVRVRKDMPQKIWNSVFDTIVTSGSPALFNEETYVRAIPSYTGVKGPDVFEFAFAGCDDFMFDGMSNIGAIEAGINLLEILDDSIKMQLKPSVVFEDFLCKYKSDLKLKIKEMVDVVNLNQMYKSFYRPLPIRTLFIDDCIEAGKEYNAGGARYNGSIINVVGLANTANALLVLKKMFNNELGISKNSLLGMLAKDYEGHEDMLAKIKHIEKYGNNKNLVDNMAKDIADFVFDEITKHRCWRNNGFFLPACIIAMMSTREGKNIDATPDGRHRSGPIADSTGPMQGTDYDGPTSMLLSVAKLPQYKAIGTLVLNIRMPKNIFETTESRQKLKALIETYFDIGGLQIQFTVVDESDLKDAIEHPEKYENLIVRVGGYTEYFNRLTEELKREVLKRTVHRM